MKKTLVLAVLLILTMFFSDLSMASISVSPAEILITMENGFIHGNTSKKITIKNTGDDSFNATWYIEHPDETLRRPNKTCMPDLSWIDVEPKWHIIQADDSADFYIYLDIPENKSLVNRHWETWITFKAGAQEHPGGVFNFEHAIRVYIDTPEKIEKNNDQSGGVSAVSADDQINIRITNIELVGIIMIILVIISLIIFKKKKP